MSGVPVSALEVALPRALAEPAAVRDARTAAEVVISLFDDHAPALLRYIQRLGLDTSSAEDVLQDTFIALHRHLALGRSRENLVGWLFQVAQNLSRREHRRRRRGVLLMPWTAAPASRLVDPDPTPAEELERADASRRALQALEALPMRDQHCVRLRAQGLRYRDIAKALGISLGSAAKSVARALTHVANAEKGSK